MNAELLMMFTLGVDRAHFYAYPERELTAQEGQRYEDTLKQRSQGMPAQYITGHQEFWGMDFLVTPAVLIPRPETEHSVETVLALVKKDAGICKLIDIGTGSGCIALALAKELPQCEIHAADISQDALAVAHQNADRLKL